MARRPPRREAVIPEGTTKSAKVKINEARILATQAYPYLAMALHAMSIRITKLAMTNVHTTKDEDGKDIVVGTPTAMVDNKFRMYIHPDAIDGWFKPEPGVACPTCGSTNHNQYSYLAGVIIHEVMHPLRHHGPRFLAIGEPDNHALWNVAADFCINGDIKEGAQYIKQQSRGSVDVCLPGGTCFADKMEPPLQANLTTEEYYTLLKDHPQVEKIQGHGGHGSGADGRKHECEDEADGDGDKGLSELERKILREKVAKETEDYNNKNPGSVPGGMVRWANDLIGPPKYDWRKTLMRKIRHVVEKHKQGYDERTYAKPNRINSALDYEIILPGYRSPVPKVGVVIDTSGSVSSSALQDAANETQGILKTLQAEAVVISCDTQAHKKVTTTMRTVELTGNGGTEMTPGIDAAREENCNIIIVFTDGHVWDWPKSPIKGVTLIQALIGRSVGDHTPKFIHTVRIPPDEVGDNDEN